MRLVVRVLELGQMVGRTMHPNLNFAAKMELTVLFNWFSLKYKTQSVNELSHDLAEVTGKPHAKFSADPKETVAYTGIIQLWKWADVASLVDCL